MINRKQIAIEFAESLKHPEIEKIILFGSVARGDDGENSDIDILIITQNVDDELKIEDDIASKAMDIIIETGEHISVKIRDKNHYAKHIDFPFYIDIEKEGVVIG
jgi:predicted nucleotidyltransferase